MNNFVLTVLILCIFANIIKADTALTEGLIEYRNFIIPNYMEKDFYCFVLAVFIDDFNNIKNNCEEYDLNLLIKNNYNKCKNNKLNEEIFYGNTVDNDRESEINSCYKDYARKISLRNLFGEKCKHYLENYEYCSVNCPVNYSCEKFCNKLFNMENDIKNVELYEYTIIRKTDYIAGDISYPKQYYLYDKCGKVIQKTNKENKAKEYFDKE